MDFHVNDEMASKAMDMLAEKYSDRELEDQLMDIAKEAINWALAEMDETMDSVMDNDERMVNVAALANRWLCVQILALREVTAE